MHSREGASSDKSVMLGRISGSRGQIGLTLEAADKARCRGVDARLATTCKRIVQSTSDPALLLGLLTVSNPKPDDVPKIPSAMGVATRLACSRAVQEGVKVELLLREAGLTRQQIDDPGVRLEVKNQIRFLELVATAVKDDFLGFHLALKVDLRKMGLLYYAQASSDTLEEALQRGVRYSSIVNEGLALSFQGGGAVGINFEYVGVARHSDRHQIEFSMVTLVRTCRQLTKRRLPASRVSFTHRRSDDISEFRTFFGCDVTFGAPVDRSGILEVKQGDSISRH